MAAWSAATVCSCLVLYMPKLAVVAEGCTMVGLATALVAMVAGLTEFSDIPEDAEIMATAYTHLGLVAGAFVGYLLMWIFQIKSMYMAGALTGIPAFVILMLGGHAGARLVYHHRLPMSKEKHR